MAERIWRQERVDRANVVEHQGVGSAYDHDGISADDLVELGLAARHAYVGSREPSEPSGPPQVVAAPPGAGEATRATPHSSTTNEPGSGCGQLELQTSQADAATGWVAEDFDFDAPEPEDGLPDISGEFDQLWYQEIPEAEDEEVSLLAPTEVAVGHRAAQLARAFLQEKGMSSSGDVDLLSDIIEHRGWSSVQHQVRGLVDAGYGIEQIHRMFQLTEAWLHCVSCESLVPEYWSGSPRLTWLEAARLLEFLGFDAELDQVADFLADELSIWERLRRGSGHLATFKGYLFNYRLSTRTQVDDGIWQSNLDPDDVRSFDGTRNAHCQSLWWDEPTESGSVGVELRFGAILEAARIADWLASESEGLY